jgi:pilus assembly protein CpaB
MRMKSLEAQNKAKPISTRTVVVAAKPLRFGMELTAQQLREVAWPEESLPNGAFSKITDLTGNGRRVVLTAIEPNEPVLSYKVTGSGQRATLSALIRDGLKAVTVRVNDVEGVAGFVLPGDRVDIQLTRQIDKNAATTEVVLQNARVLAIDQIADERSDKPTVAKAVTLEVDTLGAQKLSLAASVGSLSLMLRKAGDANSEYARRITLNDLGTPTSPVANERKGQAGIAIISVNRAQSRQEYSVPIEGTDQHAGRVGEP